MNSRIFRAGVMALGWLSLMAGHLPADVVVSTFEEPALAGNLSANQAYEGLTETASQFRSGAVTFNNDGVFFGGSSWTGFGYSRRTAPGSNQFLYDSSNDLVARPGIGAGGSATWAVVGSAGLMTADAGYRFTTLNVTNTLYSWDSMTNGDLFAGDPFGNGRGTGRYDGQDDFFTVRFTNTSNGSFLDFDLADYRVPTQPGEPTDYIINNWQLFDLTGLGANQLSISFFGSRETNYNPPNMPPLYFLDTPAYAAFDNITVSRIVAVPEPTSLVLVGSVLLLRFRRSKLRNRPRVSLSHSTQP